MRRVYPVDGQPYAVSGEIVGHLPPGDDADDFALWHVMHDDGDEEDLEAAEVVEVRLPVHPVALECGNAALADILFSWLAVRSMADFSVPSRGISARRSGKLVSPVVRKKSQKR